MNTSLLSAAPIGYNAINAIHEENPTNVVTARKPASGYIVLNSRDRYYNADPKQSGIVYQPWNDFVLQRAQALVPTFAKRIDITEVRFPWYIPNITVNNRRFGIILDVSGGTILDINAGVFDNFVAPDALVTLINASIASAGAAAGLPAGDLPVLTYTNGIMNFVSGENFTPFSLFAVRSSAGAIPTPSISSLLITNSMEYEGSPNLLTTLGMPWAVLTNNLSAPKYTNLNITGNFTMCLYTEFVDIVSDKLMRFTDARDGGSGAQTNSSLIMRLYAADEISVSTAQPVGTAPFLIHRQFATPKSIQWDPKSFVGDLDIRVLDQYGKPVYIPTGVFVGMPPNNRPVYSPISYPDFQITMLASEN